MPTLPAILAFVLDGGGGQNALMLGQLLPRGKLWLLSGAFLADVLLGSADELDRVDARVGDLLNEADPSTAVELLPEYERELALAAAPTTAERQAAIVGRLVNRQRFRPEDFRQALAPLLLQDAADVVVLERTPTFCASIDDQREIFRFFIYRDPALPGAAFIASAQALVTLMKPSRTAGYVIESVCFLYGDSRSLYGRDPMGVESRFISATAPVTTRSASLAVAAPSGTQAGDTVLFFAWANNAPNADVIIASLPAGWSVLSRTLTSIPGANQLALLLHRVATASEPSTHTFPCTHDGSHYLTGQCLAYRGLDTTAAIVAAGVTDHSPPTTSFISPAVAVASVGDAVIGFALAADNTVTTTKPSGTHQRVNQSANQDGFSHMQVFDLVGIPHGGATAGPFTTTTSANATGVAATYVLRTQRIPVT